MDFGGTSVKSCLWNGTDGENSSLGSDSSARSEVLTSSRTLCLVNLGLVYIITNKRLVLLRKMRLVFYAMGAVPGLLPVELVVRGSWTFYGYRVKGTIGIKYVTFSFLVRCFKRMAAFVVWIKFVVVRCSRSGDQTKTIGNARSMQLAERKGWFAWRRRPPFWYSHYRQSLSSLL